MQKGHSSSHQGATVTSAVPLELRVRNATYIFVMSLVLLKRPLESQGHTMVLGYTLTP